MAPKEPFQINLADLDAIRTAIPEVETKVEQKRELVSAAQREFAYWQSILERLRLVAGQKATASTAKSGEAAAKGDSAVDLVVKILDDSAVPLRAREVQARMPPNVIKPDTIGWALWKANKENRIQRIQTGVYASLDYAPSRNGEQPDLLGET